MRELPAVRYAAALMLLAASAAAAPAPRVEGGEVETPETEAARRIRLRLPADPEFRERLARRLLDSSLAGQFAGAGGPEAALPDAMAWVEQHPEDAAHLAVGFAKDDRDGTREFEKSLYLRVQRYFMLNPRRHKGILGALDAAGSESRTILSQDSKLDEDEQRELLQRAFDGQGSASGKTPGPGAGAGGRGGERSPAGHAAAGPAAFAGAGMMDRLSSVNPTGFSPQVLAFQSALNNERVPGAPRLVETGRLDFPTLVHPHYAIAYDIGRLRADLQARKAWALARALGREKEFSAERLRDPAVQAGLEKAARGKAPAREPGIERRAAALARAAAAADAFRLEAGKARTPSAITPGLLKSLGLRQKEAARWLTVAHVEGELQHLEGLSGFEGQELRRSILSAPAAEELRRAYLAQGGRIKERLSVAAGRCRAALAMLEGPAYLSKWPEVERLLAGARSLRRDAERDVALYAALPSRLAASERPRSSWRVFVDRWTLRLAPDSAAGRRVMAREVAAAAARDAFGLAAAGDFAGAQRRLSAPAGG